MVNVHDRQRTDERILFYSHGFGSHHSHRRFAIDCVLQL